MGYTCLSNELWPRTLRSLYLDFDMAISQGYAFLLDPAVLIHRTRGSLTGRPSICTANQEPTPCLNWPKQSSAFLLSVPSVEGKRRNEDRSLRYLLSSSSGQARASYFSTLDGVHAKTRSYLHLSTACLKRLDEKQGPKAQPERTGYEQVHPRWQALYIEFVSCLPEKTIFSSLASFDEGFTFPSESTFSGCTCLSSISRSPHDALCPLT